MPTFSLFDSLSNCVFRQNIEILPASRSVECSQEKKRDDCLDYSRPALRESTSGGLLRCADGETATKRTFQDTGTAQSRREQVATSFAVDNKRNFSVAFRLGL